MKTKRTIIISSLIMCLALIVTVVSATAAWFGDVKSGSISTGLIIDSDTVDASADLELDSSKVGNNTIYPAVAKPGYFNAKSYPGNYYIASDSAYDEKATDVLYPDPATKDLPDGIKDGARAAVFYLTVEYIGQVDPGYTDNKKTLLLSVEGVYLMSQLKTTTSEDGKDSNKYDGATNYGREFNVKMSVVTVTTGEGGEITSEASDPSAECHNELGVKNPYGHKLYMRVQPGKYTVKLEIYFNKVDEECNFDLLDASLNLRVTLSKDVSQWPKNGWEGIA